MRTVLSLLAAADGSVYQVSEDRVERIYPDGTVVIVVGGAAGWSASDGPPPDPNGKRATSTVIEASDVTVAPSGELYVTSAPRCTA